MTRIQSASGGNDPMRVPPNLATSKVPAVQGLKSKMLLLDEEDPGYSTEHAVLTADGSARVLSYAAEMHLMYALIDQESGHDESTAREALAQLVVAHNLRPASQRTDSENAIAWLKERLVDLAEQWNPSELARALNERDEVRQKAAQEKRN